MPVERFRDPARARAPVPADTASGNLRAAFELIEVCHGLRPITPHRGVRRYPAVGCDEAEDGRDQDRAGDPDGAGSS